LRARPFLFDCDGVLVNSEVIAVATERAHLAEAGLTYSAIEFVSRFTGLTQAAFRAALDEDSIARLGRPLPAGVFEAIKADVKARYPAGGGFVQRARHAACEAAARWAAWGFRSAHPFRR
jgi:beta-phosphoglucomutase-like phosphatase (HAD superfamily)